MLTIRPTLMLARRLHITVPRTPPPVANRVADWCTHQFNVGHTRYLIFCHTASLGKKLAKTPMRVLGWNSPNRVFPKLTGGTSPRTTA
jgi:hypothetical protein